MLVELLEIILANGTRIEVKYEVEKSHYVCDLNRGEQCYAITRNGNGKWIDVREGETWQAEKLGKLIIENLPVWNFKSFSKDA
jgi:hypothetical protein